MPRESGSPGATSGSRAGTRATACMSAGAAATTALPLSSQSSGQPCVKRSRDRTWRTCSTPKTSTRKNSWKRSSPPGRATSGRRSSPAPTRVASRSSTSTKSRRIRRSPRAAFSRHEPTRCPCWANTPPRSWPPPGSTPLDWRTCGREELPSGRDLRPQLLDLGARLVSIPAVVDHVLGAAALLVDRHLRGDDGASELLAQAAAVDEPAQLHPRRDVHEHHV